MDESSTFPFAVLGLMAVTIIVLLIHRRWLRVRQPRLSKTWGKPRRLARRVRD